MHQRVRFILGSVLLALGALLASVELFFWSWSRTAGSESDIAARAPWVFIMLLPYLVGLVTLAHVGLVAWLLRRTPISLWARLGVPVASTVLVAVLVFVAWADAPHWVLRPLRMWAGPIGPLVLTTLVAAAGLFMLWRLRATLQAALTRPA